MTPVDVFNHWDKHIKYDILIIACHATDKYHVQPHCSENKSVIYHNKWGSIGQTFFQNYLCKDTVRRMVWKCPLEHVSLLSFHVKIVKATQHQISGDTQWQYNVGCVVNLALWDSHSALCQYDCNQNETVIKGNQISQHLFCGLKSYRMIETLPFMA